MTNGRRRAVVYGRKSIKQETSEGQSASVAYQLERGRSYCEDRRWQVVGEFSDDGRSGLLDRSKRPGLDAALRMIESGDADVLVTLWTSRLSREERDRAEYLDVLDLLKAEWHAIEDGGRIDRSTYNGYMTYGVHTLFDVAYSKRVRENWLDAHEKRIKAGLPKSRSHRFGYRWDANVRAFVIQEAEAEVIRTLYRRYTRGEGFAQLVKWLNDEGWRVQATGNEWSVRTLNRFMDNGFAAGLISREEGLRDLRGAHQPIISETAWLAYRAERETRATLGKKSSGAGERWWLAGFVKCGECGGPMYVDSFKRPDGRSYVLCSNRRANPGSCSGSSVVRSYVENAVGFWLGGHLEVLDKLAGAETRKAEKRAADKYNEAVAERDKVVAGLSRLEVSNALGDIDAAVFRQSKDDLSLRLKDAERAVKEAAATLEAPTADTALLRSCATDGKWNADGRAALRGVLDRVEVGSDALTIVPVSGKSTRRGRSELVPRCGVSGCDRVAYTKGLCKSHTMRTRKVGAFDALVQRVAEAEEMPERRPTVEDVDRLLAESA